MHISARAYYSDSIQCFLEASADEVVGRLTQAPVMGVDGAQIYAWQQEIQLLREILPVFDPNGALLLEYSIPRLGRRIDAVLILGAVIFVVEFKIGATRYSRQAYDQVWDYGLDLKNFHSSSHFRTVAPILVIEDAGAESSPTFKIDAVSGDGLLNPLLATRSSLRSVLFETLKQHPRTSIPIQEWIAGHYRPTPTIIEAAMALYGGHGVAEISRSDAGALNLHRTSTTISSLIASARDGRKKVICFVTGVPGAGKTLVGLNVATEHMDKASDLYSVYLSGNGPLVKVLCEALARDRREREREAGRDLRIGKARSEVQAFIQNVHHFRDDGLKDESRPPIEHVVLFDEAQRAWNRGQTSAFMARKKGRPDFDQSEPEFLISCMDRHVDWAMIVCLVGGGQEINTGEASISEWIDALLRRFPHWQIHLSPNLHESEYGAGKVLHALGARADVHFDPDLHLGVSMRSFRAEHVSSLIKQLLDLDLARVRSTLASLHEKYPIVVTRRLELAKAWLRAKARGSERYGIVVSSEAQRLKPHAIDVKSPMDPVHWFLDGREDVRSSYYLEDVATEFQVQGLELDWACVVWDADLRHDGRAWQHHSFVGDRWNRIRKPDRKVYLENAYRVLLTRARQGMVIVVPEGDESDPTRAPSFYDFTYAYLRASGLAAIE